MALRVGSIAAGSALAALLLALCVVAAPALAQTVRIVAIGDSNTYGYGCQAAGRLPGPARGTSPRQGL